MAAIQQQKLPTGLAGVLNNPEDHRDSAYYSQKDASSKHNSTQSACGPSVDLLHSRADSASVTDNTPSPISAGPHTLPLSSPTSGAMSVASIVSPATYNFPGTYYQPGTETGASSVNGDSRRESVDSRLGTTFGDMRLASSPYASNNQSTTSLQSTLAQQRNPGSAHPDRNSGPFRFSNGYQPNFQRLPDPPNLRNARTAPTITGPAVGTIARAPEPTKGQAWAFPEEEVQRLPSAVRPSDEIGSSRQGTSFYDDSRRNSLADSIASSQFTTESRLPAGQRRLEDGYPGEYEVSTHHHSLQHRQVGELQTGDEGSPNSSTPYSRTPELRVSHKLAERKRRMEMKDLFDTLRNLQSVERGAKASKWEILTKAISEHERQCKIIKDTKDNFQRLEARYQRQEHDFDIARRDANAIRLENAQLRAELASLQNSLGIAHHGATPTPQANGYGIHSPSEQQQQQQQQPSQQQQQQLPPLRNIQGPEVMNGVQYQHEPRSDNYRSVSGRF